MSRNKLHGVLTAEDLKLYHSLPYEERPKLIFDGDQTIAADHINPYLFDAPDILIDRRSQPLCDVPRMIYGNKPVDGGNLIIEANELDDFLRREPRAKKFIRRLIGGEEFINNLPRYCLWLVDATPNEIRSMPGVYKRVEAVRAFRLASKKAATRDDAETPWLFQIIGQPSSNFIAIPRTTSDRRKYIPMGFLSPDVIVTDVQCLPDATLYHFGILTSSVHMAWMRRVCGRLGTGYRYSGTVVYNNFIWCTPTEQQRRKIESTAQKILDARAKYPDSSLADLYDEVTMPKELRAAHFDNDNAVLDAYDFDRDWEESEIVSQLMEMYSDLTETMNC